MKKIFICALLFLVSFAVSEGQKKSIKRYTIEQFLDTVSIFGSSFSADEKKILISSNKSGIYNAYSINVASGKSKQITDSQKNSFFALSYFPNDERILYRSDQGGNEIQHIYMLDKKGEITDLTPGDKNRASFYGWSEDEKSFFFTSNKRDPRYMDLYEIEIENFTAKLFYKNESGFSIGAIAPNKRYILLHKAITRNNSDLYFYDRQKKELKHLSPHKGTINFYPVTFSVDNQNLYFLTDENSEFLYLKRYNMSTDKFFKEKQVNWDIRYAYFSRSGKYMVLGINNDGRTEIQVYNTQSQQQIKLPELPNAEISSVNISKSERWMTFYVNSPRSPNNLYLYDMHNKTYRRLTNTMNPAIDADDLVDAKVVRYKSFDGLEIPAILYQPHNATSSDKKPALVWVHGGPGGQSRVGYSPLFQYLINHDYAILAVNNRGSSGYGKTFFQLDDHNHGQGDLKDCIAGKKFLQSTGYIDSGKIAIIGGSYGGYMVLAALTFQPKSFVAGVDIFGVSNWLRTLKSIPPWWEAFREALYKELGNPETEADYLRSISPLFHAEKIERPLMVLQGANDPRVLKVESDEIVAKAKKNGAPVEYIVFSDEGHGFLKKKNRIHGYKAILKFLDKYVKK